MKVFYERPDKFSNPDAEYTSDELSPIIAKQDDELTAEDFLFIFHTPLTVGSYQECAYFLPVVIDRIRNATDDDFPATVYPVFLSWIDFFSDKLQNDGLFEDVKDFVAMEMEKLLEKYNLAEKDDYPVGGSVLYSVFDGLNENQCFNFLGDKLLNERMGSSITYANAAWALELLEEYYGNLHKASQFLCLLSNNEELKTNLSNIVLSNSIGRNDDRLLRYWEQILARCGLL